LIIIYNLCEPVIKYQKSGLMNSLPISLKDIQEAAERIKKFAYFTPLYYSDFWSSKINCEIYLKLECYQPINAFKIRGAANKLIQLNVNQKKKGVVTASSGNHGLAIAYIAKRLDIPATIVVPKTAVTSKVEAIKSQGAEILYYGTRGRERIKKALDLATQTGSIFVHSFDDPQIIAGQGTIGLEIIRDLPDIDSVIVPIGGGGLISGISIALKSIKPSIKIIGVQAEGAPSMYKSLKYKKPIVLKTVNTIADGLCPGEAGKITFPIIQKFVNRIILVTDKEIKETTATLLKKTHILAEPSGAASLAAVEKIKVKKEEKIAAVISGGNISTDFLKSIL
jgi:threonine dehydratase